MKKKATLLGVLFLSDLLLPFWAQQNAQLVERYYAQGIYPRIAALQRALFGWLPFSVAELLLYLSVLLLIALLAHWVRALHRIEESAEVASWLGRCFWQGLMIFLTLHLGFLLCWGLNYYRLPLAEQLGWQIRPSSAEELVGLAEELIGQANAQRDALPEDEQGIVRFAEEPNAYLHVLWDTDAQGEPVYRRAKPVLLSPLMSYTMITGVFFPYTGEANVNMNVPLFELPFTVTHEIAHQNGIAREDEANFVSWLKARQTGVAPEIRYSATLLALTHTFNAAARVLSREEYAALWQGVSEAVDRDYLSSRQFWDAYRGPVQQASSQVNDSFLRSNQQHDGVQSYGRMVDLLLAERRQRLGE